MSGTAAPDASVSPADGVFRISHTLTIEAPRPLVYDVVSDFSRYPAYIDAAVGFKQHPAAGGQQLLHQRIDVLLQKRFAAGNFDKRPGIAPGKLKKIAKRGCGAGLFIGVAGIAIMTAQVAAAQPEKNTGVTGQG